MQTIWPAVFSRRTHGPAPALRRERWTTPDADFIDVDFLAGGADCPPAAHSAETPMLVVFHGLEGSSRSHYCQAFAEVAQERGWACALPHFRGCSGELNHAPRAYHSGDYEEIAWILAQLRARHSGPVIAAGVSPGGNALLRWAAEAGSDASSHVKAVAAICSPLDLAAGGHAIGRGFNRQIYTRMFLRTMIPKALRKWEQHPGLFDRDALLAARDLYAFDNVFTAPVHGFRNTEDYWHRASSKPLLSHIRVPALVVNALNDPFVPGPCVTLWQPSHGGHVGFAQGPWPGHVRAMPDAVSAWLTAQLPG